MIETLDIIKKAVGLAFWFLWLSLLSAVAVSCLWMGFVEILRRLT